MMAEELRLLYVATTRPQTKLILVDQVKENYSVSPVQLPLLFAKKGFSDLLLSGMEKFDKYQRVLPVIVQPEKITSVSSTDNHPIEVLRYNKQSVSNHLITPSSFEEHEIGELNLSGYRAHQRGTELHQLVETLPEAPWSKQQIKKLAPDLYDADVKRLLQLGENPFFLSLQKLEIHKEYSFIVKDDHQISHGFIDYLAIDKETITLIDFKSDRNVTSELLMERYSPQIKAYVHALHSLYPSHKIQSYIYSFELNQMIKMD